MQIQISDVLKQVPFFKTLSESDISYIVTKLDSRAFGSGKAVVRANEQGDKMFIIVSGKVRICIVSANGKEQEVAQLNAGSYFGEMALLTDEPRTASVYTLTPSEMFILDKKGFDDIILKFPPIQIELNKIMSQRLRQNLAKAMEMTKKAAEKEIVQKTATGKIQSEETIVDIMAFCDQKGLTGNVDIISLGRKGSLSFDNGQLLSMRTDHKKDDEALDEMLTWNKGTFFIKPREVSFDELISHTMAKNESIPDDDSILIVSNSLVVRKVIERHLSSLDYTTRSAKNIATAKLILDSISPRGIVSAMKFDDGSVTTLAEYFREYSINPIVIISDGKLNPDIETFINSSTNISATMSHDIFEIANKVKQFLSK